MRTGLQGAGVFRRRRVAGWDGSRSIGVTTERWPSGLRQPSWREGRRPERTSTAGRW